MQGIVKKKSKRKFIKNYSMLMIDLTLKYSYLGVTPQDLFIFGVGGDWTPDLLFNH